MPSRRSLPSKLLKLRFVAALLALASLMSASSRAIAATFPTAPRDVPPALSIGNLGKGSVPIDGPWQFHLGDDLAWASSAIDDASGHGGWEEIYANKTWGAQGHPAYVGYAWYRRHIHLAIAPGAEPNVAMLIRRIDDACDLYWNGQLIGSFGKLPPDPVHYYRPAARTFGLATADSQRVLDGVLAIRVWKAPLNSFDSDQLGGLASAPLLGSPTAIAAQKAELDYAWMRSQQFLFALTSLYALVMLLSLLFWLRDRSQRLLLWMCLYCFALVAGIVLLSLRIPFSNDFALGWFQPVFSLQDIGLWYVLLYILKLDSSSRLVRFTRFLAILSIICGSLDGMLVVITDSRYVHFAQISDAVLTFFVTIVEPFPLLLVAFGLRKRLDSARWLVAIFASLAGMFSVVRIGVQQGVRFTHWTLADKIDAPLFNILGNNFTPQGLSRLLLLVAIVYAVYRYSQEASLRQSILEQEFRSARELQQVLIPESLPSLPGYSVTSAYRPSQEVGGDFFQIIPLQTPGSESSTLIVLGDVSGKGLKAAMTVSLIVGALRSLAENTSSPAAVLAALNRRLSGRLQDGFATCLALRLDANGGCTIASAGHPAPFLNHREIDLPGSLPLGIVPTAGYAEIELPLAQGDHLALYTDGLLEARNPEGELFSFQRIQTLFAQRPTAAQASDAAVAFGQDDDITVLTLTRLGFGEQSITHFSAPSLRPFPA